MAATWRMPPATRKSDSSPRRVGVEIELQGIPVEELASLTAETVGGRAVAVSRAEFEIPVPDRGPYRVEIDFALLKELAKSMAADEEAETDAGSLGLEEMALDMLTQASALMVPCEIVSPPLPMEELPELTDVLIRRLREAGGQGTRRSPLYAFGVHLNVEPPALEADVVAAYLKAFVCLFEWIAWDSGVDLTRRITPFIDRYPDAYDVHIARADYTPDWSGLLNDYLTHNPTRNRALDMLPLFDHVDSTRVRSAVDDDLIKPRPAFHYRLGNCCIDEPGWSIADPWYYWVHIERLASDESRLAACCEAFQADRRRLLRPLDRRWREDVQQWLVD